MTKLPLSDIEAYRNPGGWVEFWIGVILMIVVSILFGRIIYMENIVKRGDAEMRQSITENITDEN